MCLQDALVAIYDEDKVEKDQLKARVEQLTMVLLKVTKSSEAIELVTSLLDELVMKRDEQETS